MKVPRGDGGGREAENFPDRGDEPGTDSGGRLLARGAVGGVACPGRTGRRCGVRPK